MMILSKAYAYADKIQAWLQPVCYRLEVAGSIRRARNEVNDIDFVCIPKTHHDYDLLKDRVGLERNELRNLLVDYVKESKGMAWWRGPGGTRADEPKHDARIFYLQLPKCKLDLFCATPENWASVLLCRTGSVDHNIWFCKEAKNRGMHWNPIRGVIANGTWSGDQYTGGEVLPAQEEEDLYRHVGLEFIGPVFRERL